MNIKTAIAALSALALLSCTQQQESIATLTARVMRLAEKQYQLIDDKLAATDVPCTTDENGELIPSNIYWWTSGFYAGSLWYIYQYTGSEDIRLLAESYTEMLDPLQWVTTDHDIGFQLNCSYGNGVRFGGKSNYEEVLYNGARSLASRYNSTVGAIKSWDSNANGWQFPVIVDNMMNLELIASQAIAHNDSTLMAIAVNHARTTIRDHYRKDFSSFHLVDYDPSSGEVRSKQTVQGYNDSSSWARGQSWGLYGFTMMYRLTGLKSFLWQAQDIADYLLRRLPDDGIPYWDYDDPAIPDTYRDASAAAIMASALAELSKLCDDGLRSRYRIVAEKIVRTLASPEYLAPRGSNSGFLLRHSVGNLPGNSQVDVPLTYADYYFLEALYRLNQ